MSTPDFCGVAGRLVGSGGWGWGLKLARLRGLSAPEAPRFSAFLFSSELCKASHSSRFFLPPLFHLPPLFPFFPLSVFWPTYPRPLPLLIFPRRFRHRRWLVGAACCAGGGVGFTRSALISVRYLESTGGGLARPLVYFPCVSRRGPRLCTRPRVGGDFYLNFGAWCFCRVWLGLSVPPPCLVVILTRYCPLPPPPSVGHGGQGLCRCVVFTRCVSMGERGER
jgi:hypothetical protein